MGVVLVTSAPAGFLLTEKAYSGGSPGVESGRGEYNGFSWCVAVGGVETEKGVVHSGISIMTEGQQFFVVVVMQLL